MSVSAPIFQRTSEIHEAQSFLAAQKFTPQRMGIAFSSTACRVMVSAAVRQELREESARTLAAEALKLECELSDLVNQAYGLTPEEITLMWKTAPPRMPISAPKT